MKAMAICIAYSRLHAGRKILSTFSYLTDSCKSYGRQTHSLNSNQQLWLSVHVTEPNLLIIIIIHIIYGAIAEVLADKHSTVNNLSIST